MQIAYRTSGTQIIQYKETKWSIIFTLSLERVIGVNNENILTALDVDKIEIIKAPSLSQHGKYYIDVYLKAVKICMSNKKT